MKKSFSRGARIAVLALGFLGAFSLPLICQAFGPVITGPAGEVYHRNLELDVDASALFYTEIGDPATFIDSESGKYGSLKPRDSGGNQ